MLTASRSPTNLPPFAQSALQSSPIYELHGLRVEHHQGSIVLSGTVSSFYHKQLAQEVVWPLCKDIEVELVNLIRVR